MTETSERDLDKMDLELDAIKNDVYEKLKTLLENGIIRIDDLEYVFESLFNELEIELKVVYPDGGEIKFKIPLEVDFKIAIRDPTR